MKDPRKLFLFVIMPVILTSLGEFIMKHAINKHVVGQTTTASSFLAMLSNAFSNFVSYPAISIGLLMIISGAILWLIAMSKFELSFLYPFQSINFLTVTLGAQWLLGESVSWERYVAVLLIMIGLVIISKSPNAEKGAS